MKTPEKKKVIVRLIQFFILGVCMGVVEDLIVIHFATDAKITLYTFRIAFFVAVPFAVIAELLTDLKIFKRIFLRK